jgi:hypothetical protein
LVKNKAYDPNDIVEEGQNQVLYHLKFEELNKRFLVTDIVWNSTGFLIAVSYGLQEHEGSC